MHGKFSLPFVLMTILIGLPIFQLEIQQTRAWSGYTIHIRADGSVDPPTAPLQRNGDIYTLTDNVTLQGTNDGIIVERNNMSLQGEGHSINGYHKYGPAKGIWLGNVSNITIENLRVQDFEYGIYLDSASYVNLRGNIVSDNRYNFGVRGEELNHFMHTIDTSNFVDGKPVYYMVNQTDVIINANHPQVGYLALVNCVNVTLEGLDLTNHDDAGVLFAFTNESRLTHSYIAGNEAGISIEHCSDISISGTVITDNYDAIISSNSSKISIFGNNVTANRNYGMWLGFVTSSSIYENNIKDQWEAGIGLGFFSEHNNIYGNNITGNAEGAFVFSSSYNNFSSNILANDGIDVLVQYSEHNVISENTMMNSEYGVGFNNCSNSWILDNSMIANKMNGVRLIEGSNNNTIARNAINASKDDGIELSGSSNNTIHWNTISSSSYDGIVFDSSSFNTISENTISRNGVDGVALGNSPYNNILSNIIANNGRSSVGVFSSRNNLLFRNTMSNGERGVDFYSHSDNNTVCENIIENNEWGIFSLYECSGNKFYHNNFIDNALQTQIVSSSDFWDAGYPSGGNYWSDYNGIDLKSGPNQDQPGNDGIGDVPYLLLPVHYSVGDRYPLMNPYGGYLDQQPPSITILSPQDRSYSTRDVPLIFLVSKSTPWLGYRLDTQSNETIGGNMTLNGLSEGAHTVTVYGNNTSGYMGRSSTVHFVIDTLAPTIEVLSPENVTYPTNSVFLSFAVNEVISVVRYSLDGQKNLTITGNITLTGLSDGSHYLVVYANDTAGNTGASQKIFFSVDAQSRFLLMLGLGIIVTIVIVGATGFLLHRKRRRSLKPSSPSTQIEQ